MAWILDAAQRALRLSRSSPVAVALLVGSNLMPLVGVLYLGWDLGLILTAYWLENGIVGLLNVAKIALAAGDTSRVAWASRAYTMCFFTVHYGIFWLVHGTFVGVVAAIADQGGFDVQVGEGAFIGPFGFPLGAWGLDPLVLGLVAMALAISHGVSFWLNFLGKGEYRSATAQGQMWAPYGRMMVLHLTLLGGAFVLAGFGAPSGPIAVMVVVKTVLDLALHLRERQRAAARASS